MSEVLSALLDESGYEQMLRTEGNQERLDNLAELKQSVYEFEATCGEEVTIDHYLHQVALLSNADIADASKDNVRLMTIHAAKGLEFNHVFVCSLSEGVLPSRKTRTVEAMEEERRLAFVAFTRAKDGCTLLKPRVSAIRERRGILRGSSSISTHRLWSFQIGLLIPSLMMLVALMRLPIAGSLTWPGGLPSNPARALPIKRSGRALCRASTSRSGPISSHSTIWTRRVAFRFASSWR